MTDKRTTRLFKLTGDRLVMLSRDELQQVIEQETKAELNFCLLDMAVTMFKNYDGLPTGSPVPHHSWVNLPDFGTLVECGNRDAETKMKEPLLITVDDTAEEASRKYDQSVQEYKMAKLTYALAVQEHLQVCRSWEHRADVLQERVKQAVGPDAVNAEAAVA